jgi:hypothetical protein
MTFTKARAEAENSVTELPSEFATQTWVPSEVMSYGPVKPHPESLAPESAVTGLADGEVREALLLAAPKADADTKAIGAKPARESAPTTTVRLNRRKPSLIDGPPRIGEGISYQPTWCSGAGTKQTGRFSTHISEWPGSQVIMSHGGLARHYLI